MVSERAGESALEIAQPARLAALRAVSPLDGRYHEAIGDLVPFFSEEALIRHRLEVETEYFISLLHQLGKPLEWSDVARLRSGYQKVSASQFLAIKDKEGLIGHDVKAVEYHLKEQVGAMGLASLIEMVHFGLTSEDVNNLAYARMQQRALQGPIWSAFRKLVLCLVSLVQAHRDTAMLARTHGQPATPTTLGKELGVFLSRLTVELESLMTAPLPGKLSGATGTYGAHHVAFPSVDWRSFSERFVVSLGLSFTPLSTQREPHDGYASLYDRLRRCGNILLGLSQDLWRYISDGWFTQIAVTTQIGSSAMPHKINPIEFENAEGNLGLAAALWVHLSEKLTRSRLQRDLSDSTVMRNVGVAFGHLLLALQALVRGFERVRPDIDVLRAALIRHPEVLAEAYQAILRVGGYTAPYEALHTLTRGKAVTLEDLREWADRQAIPGDVIDRLRDLVPEGYLGLAPELADQALGAAKELLARIPEKGTA